MNEKKVVNDYFIYSANFADLAAGDVDTQIINIEADANFIAVKFAYFAEIAGGAQTDSSRVVPLVTMEIQDSGSGRNLQNIAVPVDAMAGRGELPFILPIPRQFKANASIKLTARNVSAGTTYNLSFSLIGYKVFRLG